MKNSLKTENYKLKIALFALCLFLWSNQATASTIGKPSNFLALNTGLVGHWTFDGPKMLTNVADSSGQGNIGYLSHGGSGTTTVPGKLGQALSFDGVNDTINFGSGSSLDDIQSQGGGGMTLSFWINPKSYGASNIGQILRKPNNSSAGFWVLRFADSTGLLQFLKDFTTADINKRSGSNAVPLNTWTHVVLTWDGGDYTGVKYFINNKSSAGSASGGTGEVVSDANSDLSINGAVNWAGTMDDVRIYNRVLSAGEITQLYNIGSAKFAVTPALPLTSGLVGWWTFDGPKMLTNVADSSGQGNIGYLVHGGSGTTTAPGKVGQALSFDGSNDYIKVPDNSSLDVSTFSIGAWFKLNSLDNIDDQIIERRSGTYNNYYLNFWLNINDDTDDKIYAMFGNGVSQTSSFSSDNSIIAGQWYNIIYTFDGITARMYINGILQSNTATPGFNPYNSGDQVINIGRDNNSGTPSKYFRGFLDDIRIYNRALSASEITQLYNIGAASKVASTPRGLPGEGLNNGLVGHWSFDGPRMLTNVADSSGLGNNGYMSGFTSTSSAQVAGKIGQGLSFDGVDDLINTGSDLVGTGADTIAMWVYPRSYGEGGVGLLMGNGVLRFFINSGSSNFRFRGDGATTAEGFAPTFNQWTHIVVTRDASGITNFYKNGVQTGTANQSSGTPAAGSTNIFIGNNSTATQTFDGSLDDVRIYNRVLSATEIKQLYNLGR